MNNQPESCCFTGYRPQKFPFPIDRANAEYLKFENKLTDAVFSVPSRHGVTFYTGMAMGFDLIAAETVLLYRRAKGENIRLIGVIPFKGQSSSYPSEWRSRYNSVAAQTDELIFLEDVYSNGCYQRRNEYMVDRSDMVITWFDGAPGGTLNTIRYAKRRNKRIVNLYEEMSHEYVNGDLFSVIPPDK